MLSYIIKLTILSEVANDDLGPKEVLRTVRGTRLNIQVFQHHYFVNNLILSRQEEPK